MQINERAVEGARVTGIKEQRAGTSRVQEVRHNGRVFYQALEPTTKIKNQNAKQAPLRAQRFRSCCSSCPPSFPGITRTHGRGRVFAGCDPLMQLWHRRELYSCFHFQIFVAHQAKIFDKRRLQNVRAYERGSGGFKENGNERVVFSLKRKGGQISGV